MIHLHMRGLSKMLGESQDRDVAGERAGFREGSMEKLVPELDPEGRDK